MKLATFFQGTEFTAEAIGAKAAEITGDEQRGQEVATAWTNLLLVEHDRTMTPNKHRVTGLRVDPVEGSVSGVTDLTFGEVDDTAPAEIQDQPFVYDIGTLDWVEALALPISERSIATHGELTVLACAVLSLSQLGVSPDEIEAERTILFERLVTSAAVEVDELPPEFESILELLNNTEPPTAEEIASGAYITPTVMDHPDISGPELKELLYGQWEPDEESKKSSGCCGGSCQSGVHEFTPNGLPPLEDGGTADE